MLGESLVIGTYVVIETQGNQLLVTMLTQSM